MHDGVKLREYGSSYWVEYGVKGAKKRAAARLSKCDSLWNERVETSALEKLMKRRANDKLTEKKDHEVLKMVKTPQMTFQS